MKNLTKLVLVFGMFFCSFAFGQNSQNKGEIEDIVSGLKEVTILYGNKKISNTEIDQTFDAIMTKKGYNITKEYKDVTYSDVSLEFLAKIQNSNFETLADYLIYLDGLKMKVNSLKTNETEKEYILNALYFQKKIVEMVDNVEEYFNPSVSSAERVKWRCIIGGIGGHATGLVFGCGSIGLVGAAIGGGWGAAVGCWAGGTVGSMGGFITGMLGTSGC